MLPLLVPGPVRRLTARAVPLLIVVIVMLSVSAAFAQRVSDLGPIYARNDMRERTKQSTRVSSTGKQASIREALNPDGTLKPGSLGSFSAEGFQLRYGKSGEPQFFDAPFAAGDERWQSIPDYQGLNGAVSAIAVDAAQIYIAGNFTDAGGNPNADGIAMWNGATWSALGTGLNFVGALTLSGSTLYVGGAFENAGGVAAADRIARWNGSSWSALGSGIDNGGVGAIAIIGSDIYVAGSFNNAAGIAAADQIARWNGTSWSALGSSNLTGYVEALVVSGSNLYVGGGFENAGGVANADLVAMWNGTTWSALGTGLTGFSVYSLAAHGTNIYVGGSFTDAGGIANADGIAMWNGTAWSALGTGVPGGGVYAIAVLETSFDPIIYIGGNFSNAGGNVDADYIALWAGTSWSSLGTGVASWINVLALQYDDYLIAGGNFTSTNTKADYVATWDGANWQGLGSGLRGDYFDTSVSAVAISGSDVYVGGYFHSAGGVTGASSIARWNGTTWSALGSGIYGGYIRSIAVSGSNVYVAGSFTNAGGVANASGIARWDGTNWNAMGTGIAGSTVNVVAVHGTDVYIGGNIFDVGGNTSADYLARWDGSNWNALGTGVTGTVHTITSAGSDLYVGGSFPSAGGLANSRAIARWNGTAWNTVGNGITLGEVRTIAVLGAQVYVGGTFINAGGVAAADAIAIWNGTNWSALGSGITELQEVYSIATIGTQVYVGGSFTNAGGNANADRIAVWSGSAWSAIGSGLDGGVTGIALSGSRAYMVGGFRGTGDNSVSAIRLIQRNGLFSSAQLQDHESTGPIELKLKGTVYPGGLTGTYRFEWGTASGNPNNFSTAQAMSGGTATAVFQDISWATPNSTIYYRIRVENDEGIFYSPERSYTFPPEIELRQGSTVIASGGEYNFGNVNYLSSSADVTFSIFNFGLGNLALTGSSGNYIVKGGTNPGDFTVTQTSVFSPLSYNTNQGFNITFTPATSGLRSATITIGNNDPSEGTYTINLKGTGVKLNQTITFNALPVKTFGEAPFVLSATSTSGLPISYTSGTPSVATVSGSTVTLVAPGSTTITALQVGNGNYNAATSVQQVLVVRSVEPAAQPTNLTFNSLTSSSLNGLFTAASGSPTGYLVLQRTGSSPTDIPQDGTEYVAGNDFGSSKIISVGGTVSFTSTGLTSGATYFYDVFAYNGSGASINYRTTSPLESSVLTLVVEPSAQPANLLFSAVTTSSMEVSFSAAPGNPLGYIVLRKDGTSPSESALVDGTTYTVGNLFGTSRIVYVGGSTTFTSSGLSPGVVYHYDVFSYNGTGGTINYLPTSPLEGSRTTLAADPVAQPSALSFSNITSASLSISFAAATGPVTGYVVLQKAGSSPTEVPVDGTTYVQGADLGTSKIISVGSALTVATSGLSSGTTYYFDVFAFNGSGSSINYLTNAPLEGTQFTLVVEPTAQPTAISFSAITTSSMSVSFTPATGSPSGYIVLRKEGQSPDESPFTDGTSFTVGNTYGTSRIVYIGASATFVSDGLTAGTTYHYEAFAYNGAGLAINYLNSNPLEGSRSTVAPEPAAQPTNLLLQDVTNTTANGSFTASGGSVTGYLVLRAASTVTGADPVDGTTYTTTLGAWNVIQSGSTTTFSDTGLLEGATYTYKVYAFNGSLETINYLSVNPLTSTTLTLPPAPVALEAGNPTTNSFRARWETTKSAVSYELDVSTSLNFDSFLSGFSAMSTTNLDVTLSTLIPDKTYHYRVRAKNATGISVNSATISVTTIKDSGVADLSIGTPTQVSEGAGIKVSVAVTAGSGPREVRFYSKGILSSSAFSSVPVDPVVATPDTYSVNVATADLDDIGVEYYFTASDVTVDSPLKTASKFIYRSIGATEKTIPTLSSGGQLKDYTIFSIPYALADNDIVDIFDELGKYEKFNWRLLRYQNGKNTDYTEGLTKIEPGKGYWFNALTKTDVAIGAGTVTQINGSEPFKLRLEKDWNQIGNPFTFNIDWSDVIAANPGVANKVDHSILAFDGSISNFKETDVLSAWGGGFVFAEEAVELDLKVTLKSSSSGRKGTTQISGDLNNEEWYLPISLEHNGSVNTYGGIGMHPGASNSKDIFDMLTVPRFVQYLEWNTHHKEFFSPYFTRDVVTTSSQYSWKFLAESNFGNGTATLKWDNRSMGFGEATLFLFDEDQQALVNMKTSDSYRFELSDTRSFRIFFSMDGKTMQPDISMAGLAYPNPVFQSTTIPFIINKRVSVQISLFDLSGRKVKDVVNGIFEPGIHAAPWDKTDQSGIPVAQGLYIYRMNVDGMSVGKSNRIVVH
jgi:hypothetical protein